MLFVIACVPKDLVPYVYNSSPFSQETQAKGNALCAGLFGNAKFNHLKGKIPIKPGDIPTRDMLHISVIASETEVAAIQLLESSARNCTQLREAAGVPTSATEDILAARISKLRYGLYKGLIPYAVYNYGIVQAMRKNNDFIMNSEQSVQKGKAIGDEKQNQAWRDFQTSMQINSLNSSIDTFNTNVSTGAWVCSGSGCF
ncbi:MAG: hypothetical protein JKY92_03795 [Magnetovibrio sp.]|nr:hypothetical protein [Magnetovibrio sp.]